MMKFEDRFENMRKRAVSDIVQKRGALDGNARVGRNFIIQTEFRQDSRRQMKRAQTVRKARMLRRLISEMRQT